MSLSGKKVLVLAADLVDERELLYPTIRLREEGADVVVAGLTDEPVKGNKGMMAIPVDRSIAGVKVDDFDGVVIPGGFAPDFMRRSQELVDLVRDFEAANKPIGFICHAGWVPVSAGLLKGRRATSFFGIKDDLINAGAEWVDEAVVVDGPLISSRTPDDLGPFMKAVIAALEAQE